MAVWLVNSFHVLLVPGWKELKQRAEVNRLFAIHVFQRRIESREQRVVRIAVFTGSRESMLLQQLLFALEVHLREIDKALKLKADLAAVRSVRDHPAKFVQRVHQDAMLIVHGLHSDDAVVAPGQQRHINLPASEASLVGIWNLSMALNGYLL